MDASEVADEQRPGQSAIEADGGAYDRLVEPHRRAGPDLVLGRVTHQGRRPAGGC